MLTLEELIQKPDLLGQIDWDLNPQEAFEMYQVKSKDSWKYRHLPEVLYFYVDVWKGKAEVFLMRRSLKSAEDIALIPAPTDLIDACLKKQTGEPIPSGQHPIDDPIRDWIRSELDMQQDLRQPVNWEGSRFINPEKGADLTQISSTKD